MAWDRFDRRKFLRGASGFMLPLPYLASVMSTSAKAQAVARPPGFIFLFSSLGEYIQSWYPSVDPTDGWRQRDTNIREATLTNFPGNLSVTFGSAFDASIRQKMLVLSGLDLMVPSWSHMAQVPLTGMRGFAPDSGIPQAISIDQVLKRYVYSGTPAVPDLHLGVSGGFTTVASVSTDLQGSTLTSNWAENDPRVAFDNMFSGGNINNANAAMVQKRTYLLDRVLADYKDLSKSSRLSADDKNYLQSWVTLVDDLERRIKSTNVTQCATPNRPDPANHNIEGNLQIELRDQIDLIVAAFACDLTRIATLVMVPETDVRSYGWLAGYNGGNHHELSHNARYDPTGALVTEFSKISTWVGTQVADIVKKLDVVEDQTTGATILDRLAVYWGNSGGTKVNTGEAHDTPDLPVALFGGCNGYFKTNRWIDYRNQSTLRCVPYGTQCYAWGNFLGRPYNQFGPTIFDAFGLTPAQWQIGPLQGPNIAWGDDSSNFLGQYTWNDAMKTQPLPFVKG